MSKKVFLGVGHGGSDPGAVANGFQEKDLNFSIALACYEVLSRHGVNTLLSREKDEDDPLEERIRECISFGPTVAIDIHNNAGGGSGVEVFHSLRDKSDDVFAKNVLDAIVAIGQNSRGLKTKLLSDGKRDYFGFIRQINEALGIPSILVECAFVDNKADLAIIDTSAEQKAMGIAIAKGILKTLGMEYREVSAPVVTYAEGSVVQFKGGKHYTSASGNTGYEVKAGPARITRYLKGAKHPYHVVHTDSTSTVYGWVDADAIELTAATKTLKVGDVVDFVGSVHYASSNAASGSVARKGPAKITNIAKGAKHPYHIVHTNKKSNVYGWVNADAIK